MEEPFGKIVTIIIVIGGLFILPLLYIGQKQDSVVQSYVYNETVRFVEDVEKNGYLSQTMYDDFNRRLANTDVIYDVRMEHVHEVVEPVFSADGTAVVGTDVYESARYEDDILDTLYSDVVDGGIYKFSEGDYFTVTVYNKSKLTGQKMNKLINQVSSKYAVYATFGGVIRNENY